jgi:hypothetical protein
VRNGAQRGRRQLRPGYRVADIRALLHNREFIKVATFVLPTPTKRQVLEMMDQLRRSRMTDPSGQPLSDLACPLPEMTDSEMVREINWRVGTLPPRDAETLVQYVRRLTRWRAERRTKAPPTRVIPAAPSPVTPPDHAAG